VQAEFVRRNHKDDWVLGVKSNMEFLMMVNKFSSRSFNDVAQYPIFPWIFTDYTSNWKKFQELRDRKPTEVYRDLRKHLSVISK